MTKNINFTAALTMLLSTALYIGKTRIIRRPEWHETMNVSYAEKTKRLTYQFHNLTREYRANLDDILAHDWIVITNDKLIWI